MTISIDVEKSAAAILTDGPIECLNRKTITLRRIDA